MSQFHTPLRVEALRGPDGKPLFTRDGRRLFALVEAFHFQSDLVGDILVEAGYVTDFGSVPRLPVVYEVLGDIAFEPYVIHDVTYSKGLFPRDVCDRVLAEALRVEGVVQWKVDLIYQGVRLGGGSHFADASR